MGFEQKTAAKVWIRNEGRVRAVLQVIAASGYGGNAKLAQDLLTELTREVATALSHPPGKAPPGTNDIIYGFGPDTIEAGYGDDHGGMS